MDGYRYLFRLALNLYQRYGRVLIPGLDGPPERQVLP